MNALLSWFHQQAEREKRVVSLQDALLSNRFLAYAWVRLRYFTLRFGMASALPAVKVALLYQVFSHSQFVAVLLIQTALGLVGSFWWGLLELMRERVRDLYRSGERHRIPQAIAQWLSFSVTASIVTLMLGLASAGWWVWHQGQGFGAADLYVLAIVAGFALRVPARCYHSGIYAIRRIYRPPLAIVTVEAVSFVGVLGFWPWLGTWSLPIGAIISTLTATGVMVHYTRRTYDFFRFAPSRFFRLDRPSSPQGVSAVTALKCGLSYVAMNMDSLLVLAMFTAAPGAVGRPELFIIFFLLSPAIRAGSDWAQLFYFDLKRLEIRPFGSLRRRFEKHVLWLALGLPLVLWALSMVVAALAFQQTLGDLYWLMIPFFIARSLLAAVQVQSFSRGAYGVLLTSGALLMGGFVAVGRIVGGEGVQLIWISVIMLSTFFVLRGRLERVERDREHRRLLWPSEWLARLGSVTTPVRVSAAQFWVDPNDENEGNIERWARDNRWRHGQVGERIAVKIGVEGGVTLVRPGRIVWYELAAGVHSRSLEWIMIQGAGLLRSIGHTGIEASGLAALKSATARDLLGDDLSGDLSKGVEPVRLADVHEAFRALFPGGVIYDPNQPAAPLFDGSSSNDRSLIWRDAMEFARGTRPRRENPAFEVTALCPGGQLQSLFLVDRRAKQALRSEWRQAIRQFNLRASLGTIA